MERRVRTDRRRFAKWLGKRDKAGILVESSTENRPRIVVADGFFVLRLMRPTPTLASSHASIASTITADSVTS